MKNKKTKPIDSNKAFKYYSMGLDRKEIAILLGCSFRTIQNYMSEENWKEKRGKLKK